MKYAPLPAEDLHELLQRDQQLWPALRGARILLTGGTGFFGQWLVESLLHANDALGLEVQLTLLSRDPQAVLQRWPHWQHPAIDWLAGDVRDVVWPERQYSHVLHAATDSSPAAQADALALLDQVVGGTRRLLDWAVGHGVARFLYISSGAVYGELPPGPVAESYTGAPDSMQTADSYGQAKRFAEQLCVQYASRFDLNVCSARCFAFVGPGLPMDGHFAIGNFIGAALAGQPLSIHSDGRALRSYLYAGDLAQWLWTLLLRGENCRAYNVGSDQAISVAELARLVAATLAPALPVTIGGGAAGGRRYYVPAIDGARQLGLAVWTPLPQAIHRTAQWAAASSPSHPFQENA